MQCPQCHYKPPTDAAFCPACGSKLVILCAQCQTTNAPDHKFCKQCGQPLAVAAAAAPGAPTFTSSHTYTPKYLAEKILTSRSALEGERKEVTVLFCDVVDSTRLAEQLDPEAMHQLMDRLLRLMADAVHRYEGTVNQFLGDGLMALFGAPLALAARIDRLPAAAKDLLQTTAVLGKEFPLALLQVVTGQDEDAVRRDLAHLQAAEFVYGTRLFPEAHYAFAHSLTHEVAYQSLLQERRRALHAQVVEAIEALYADRLGEWTD